MEVKLEKKDWEEALRGAIGLLKTAMAHTEIYKIQVNVAEAMVKKFPADEKEEQKVPIKA